MSEPLKEFNKAVGTRLGASKSLMGGVNWLIERMGARATYDFLGWRIAVEILLSPGWRVAPEGLVMVLGSTEATFLFPNKPKLSSECTKSLSLSLSHISHF